MAADGGCLVFDTVRLADVAACDVLLVPGGFGVIAALGRRVHRPAAPPGRLTAPRHWRVHPVALALAAAGLLNGRRAACPLGLARPCWRRSPASPDDGRVVRAICPVITGGGGRHVGIDLALVLLAELNGVAAAQDQLGYQYEPAPVRTAAARADPTPPVAAVPAPGDVAV